MSWSEYKEKRDQAFNVGEWKRGRDLRLQTESDEHDQYMQELEKIRPRVKTDKEREIIDRVLRDATDRPKTR